MYYGRKISHHHINVVIWGKNSQDSDTPCPPIRPTPSHSQAVLDPSPDINLRSIAYHASSRSSPSPLAADSSAMWVGGGGPLWNACPIGSGGW